MLRGTLVDLLATLATASATAAAPSHDAGDAIIVTGERVARSLKETQSSVAVVTERDMEANGASTVDDVLAGIPNVQLGNGSEGPAIRGLDTTGPLQALPAFLGGNRPRTTIVVDGRPVTYNEFVFGSLPTWDVNRIEVFRSPQTTTQGVNSIAGAIFVTSNDPDFTPEARLRLAGGNYRTGQLSALVSGPLSRDVALRVAGDLRYSRTTSAISNTMAGADPNHQAFGLIRTKLLIDPERLKGTTFLFTYTHALSQSPQTVGVTAPFRERRDITAAYGVFRVGTDSLTASLHHRLGQGLTANALLTGGRSNAQRFAIPGLGETRNHSNDWSGETVFSWSKEESLNIVGGVSHSHVALRQTIDLSLLSGLAGRFEDLQDGSGLFGEASFKVAARTTVTAGLRYQQDQQKRQGALVSNTFSVPANFVGKFHAWLPKFSIAQDISNAWHAGILIQRAYNPGGTTIRVDTARPDNFAAETLWDTELFARGSLFNGRAQLSANLFHYAMQNAQRAEPILISTPTGRPVGFANLFNVPRARSYGLEATAGWQATEALTAQLSIALLDTKITRTDVESAALNGKQFDRSPHFSVAAGIRWRPLDALQLSAKVRHHSRYYSDISDSADLLVGYATIVDASAEYRLKQMSVFLQVRNLLDKFSMLALATRTSGEAEDPRRIMLGIDAPF